MASKGTAWLVGALHCFLLAGFAAATTGDSGVAEIRTGWNFFPLVLAVDFGPTGGGVTTKIDEDRLSREERHGLRGVRLWTRRTLDKASLRRALTTIRSAALRARHEGTANSSGSGLSGTRLSIREGGRTISVFVPRAPGYDSFHTLTSSFIDVKFVHAVQQSMINAWAAEDARGRAPSSSR
jgi:hypothetical protein